MKVVLGNYKGNQGFTIVELLVALTIFSIGLLALASMQITAIQGNAQANRLSQEASMAQGVMEQILAWKPNDARLNSSSSNQTWVFSDGSTTYSETGSSNLSARYTVVANSPLANMATITVNVQGPEGVATLTEYKKTIN